MEAMFRPSRSNEGTDPYVHWKVRCFFAGAVVAAVGMATEKRWLVWAGVGILAVGLVLGIAARARSEDRTS